MKHNKNNKTIKRLVSILKVFIMLLPAALAFFGQRLLAMYPEFVEKYFTTLLFRFISRPVAFFSSLFWFSLTEMLIYLAIPTSIFLIYYIVIKFKNSENKLNLFANISKKILLTISSLYLIFMLLHGFNYARMPISETMDLNVKQRSSQEVFEVAKILQDNVNFIREDLIEDDNKNMILSQGISNSLKSGYLGFESLESEYDIFKIPQIRAKSVIASNYWSYTGIVGMYFPFFVEANINTDVPHSAIPATIMHELAHTIGFAREDEAEFVSFVTGINHPDQDFIYSSYLKAYIYVRNALYRNDKDLYNELVFELSDGAERDISQKSEYHKQFQGPVKEVSTSVNNAYLQTNLQTDGVKSYGRVVDLILAYYLS